MSTGAYTKCAWVNWTDDPATVYNNILSGQTDHALWIADFNGGERLTAGHHGSWFDVADPELFVPGVWTFVAVTYDPALAGGTLTLYKNGLPVSAAGGITPTTDARAYVGAFSGLYQLKGSIDDARIYNRALSPTQVGALFAGGNSIVAAETVTGDQWQAQVTPFSADAAGATVASNTITVQSATAPTLGNLNLVSTSGNSQTSDDLTCQYDLTGYSVTAATAWLRNGLPDMLAYMPMEGGATGALLDYSGNGHHGAPGSDPAWMPAGGHDTHGSFEFDGNDYIAMGAAMPGAGAYTKAVWVYWTPGAFMNNILSGNSGHALWVTSFPEGNEASPVTDYYLSAGHNESWRDVKDTGSFPVNQWVHVAVSYDPVVDGGTMVLYRDGAEVDRSTGIAPTTDALAFLGAFRTSGPYFLGRLDEARVYARALSGAQVASLHDAGRDVIVAAETATGDTWQAVVTPFSDTEAGASAPSNVLTIVDYAVGVDEPTLPGRFMLHNNAPNPFNPMTLIRYDLPEAARVSLRIFDISGRLVAVLKDDAFEAAGQHEVAWPGRDRNGQHVAAGVYFCNMSSGTFNQTRRMVLVK